LNNNEFAWHLSSFLSPVAAMESVRRYSDERKKATTETDLIITSGHLSFGNEGNYAELVKEFLRGFRMPSSFVAFLKEFYGTQGYSRSTWRWIEELSLACNVRTYRHGAAPSNCPRNTILLVQERDAVLEMIRDPLLALLDMVDRASMYWRQAAMLGARMYFVPNAPDAFFAYTEYRTASYFIDFVPAPDELAQINVKTRYRAITTTGSLCGREAILGPAREAARAVAASTFRPIKETC
jgi:hypothetical protein